MLEYKDFWPTFRIKDESDEDYNKRREDNIKKALEISNPQPPINNNNTNKNINSVKVNNTFLSRNERIRLLKNFQK